MSIIMAKNEWTLSEAARVLGVRQHRLIYLCEKKVVVPDFSDATGRGSSRRFSPRNLLEFSVALKLREMLMPVAPIAAIIYILRAFEKNVVKEMPGFKLPQSLLRVDSPELRIVVSDGPMLFFELHPVKGESIIYGGLDIGKAMLSKRMGRKPESGATAKFIAGDSQLKKESKSLVASKNKEGKEQARFVVSVTNIARELNLKA